MLDVMRRLLAPVVSCAIGALALFSVPQESKAQVAGFQSVSVPGCNATSLAQVPGTTDMFIGRELINTTSDPCSGSTWGLWLFRFDWQTQTFTTVKPLLLPLSGGLGGIPLSQQKGILTTAYDATVADLGGELWVAFECSGTGNAFPAGTVSSCTAPLSTGDYSIDFHRLTVVIAGVPTSGASTGYSASVPKIFAFQGVPYMYWTAVESRKATNGDVWTRVATRGVQLTRNSNGLLWAVNTQSSVPANQGDEVYGSSADGVVGDLADGYDVKVIDGRLLMTSGAGNTGCVTPLSRLFGCYRLQIRTSATPLGYHVYNNSVASNIQLPFNPQEYGRMAQDPAGNWQIFGAFLTPYTTGSNSPANVVPSGIARFPFTPSALQFGLRDANPLADPVSGPTALDVPWDTLQALNLDCRSDSPRPGTDSNPCASATVRYCVSQGYAGGGLMVEYGINGQVLCFRGEHARIVITPISTLTARNSDCTAGRLFSDSCASAISGQCTAMGYAGGGFGPMEYTGTAVQISCLDSTAGNLVGTTFTELNAYNNCSASGWTESGLCMSATNRLCLSKGYAGGFGITDHFANGANVGCARANVPK